MDIRLVLFDLDGTLLDAKKNITEKNLEALREMEARGVVLVPSTGRFYRGMPQAILDMPFRYAVTINGANVLEIASGTRIYRADIDPDTADRVFAHLEALDDIYDCYQDDWGYMPEDRYARAAEYVPSPPNLKMVRELRKPVKDFRAEMRRRGRPVQKIQAFFADPALRRHELETLPSLFPGLAVTSSISNNVEINHEDANKGAALLALCGYLGLDPAQALAIGDGLNDTSMIRAAGVGVAMENGEPSVKAAADHVTASADAGGFADAMRRFVL